MPNELTKPNRPIAEIEAENRKEMTKVREKEKEKEKAEEDQQFVIDMAVIECMLCTVPMGMLKVNFDTPTIQNKKIATVKEKDNKSLMFMGTCLKSPNAAAPCTGVMQLGEWQDTGTILVQDEKPLLKKSTIMCNYGGSTITIKKSGQINVPSAIEPAVKSPKEILSAVWINHETKEEIEDASIGDNVNILVKTKNYKPGQMVFLDITKSDDSEVKDGKTMITVSGVVKADGSALLTNHFTL
jgi:hypothetical protein